MTDTRDPGGFDPYEGLNDLTGEEPLPLLEDPTIPPATPPRSPLLTGLIVGLLLVALSVAVWQLLRSDGTSEAEGTTTTSTTVDDGTTSTTSGNETSTTSASSTTVPASFEPYVAAGEPLTIGDLTLAVDAVGPIDFGTPAADAMGRLVASLGEPDADSGPVTSTGAYGVCEGDTERIVRWGPFAAVVTYDGTADVFNGYRLDLAYGDLGSPTTELATLSGLKAGDQVSRFESIYAGFDKDYVVTSPLGVTFELRSTNTGNLLLWGPVTSADPDGIVLGIYAPDVCGRTS